METIDKKGRKLIKAELDAAAERAGLKVLFVVDNDVSELLRQVLTEIQKITEKLEQLD